MGSFARINTDNLVTIPKSMLETRIVALSAMKIDALDLALGFSLGLTGR